MTARANRNGAIRANGAEGDFGIAGNSPGRRFFNCFANFLLGHFRLIHLAFRAMIAATAFRHWRRPCGVAACAQRACLMLMPRASVKNGVAVGVWVERVSVMLQFYQKPRFAWSGGVFRHYFILLKTLSDLGLCCAT